MTVVFETCSVLLGGSYWNHYLVQLVAPLSVLVGVAAARAFTGMRPLIAATLSSREWRGRVALPWQHTSLGAAWARRSPGWRVPRTRSSPSTDIRATRASGLASPYPYLWSLPAKTRDPDLHLLAEVLSGPQASTWFVTWRSHLGNVGSGQRLGLPGPGRALPPGGRSEGHTIYLLNGVRRRAPTLDTGPLPRTPPLITTFLKELLP